MHPVHPKHRARAIGVIWDDLSFSMSIVLTVINGDGGD